MKKLLLLITLLICFYTSNASSKTLSYIPQNPTRALIVIHGYSSDGYKMSWMTDPLKKELPDMAFYYPTALRQSPFGGYEWFEIPAIGEEIRDKAQYDEMMRDALENVTELHNLIDEIHQDLDMPYENIYLSGFSQGGLMALLTALTSPHNLQVAVSFSGVPLLFTRNFTKDKVKGDPDILLIQGDRDTVIPKDSIKMTTETLQELQIEPTIQIIQGLSHQISKKALEYMIDFIR